MKETKEIKEFINKHNLTLKQFYGIDKIEGSLDLSSLKTIPEGFNPTVGGSLFLNDLTSISEDFNPKVRDSLILPSLTTIPKGFNPTVGSYLYLPIYCDLTNLPKNKKLTICIYQ